MRRRTEPTPGPAVRRSRPLLGTYVAIGVAGLDEPEALRAIERGFAAIADIHRLMSFHEPGSDVSRVNRGRPGDDIAIDPRTFVVLEQAGRMSAESGGIFDITVAAELVARSLLPAPDAARAPDPAALWRDIELKTPVSVRLDRPLWIDLGGIAKGFAVDEALRTMGLPPGVQCSVNAGGDLAVRGPQAERILLRAPASGGEVPVLEIENAALASSSGEAGAHLDGTNRQGVGIGAFVSVVAESCMMADGLTKIVLALGPAADTILKRHGATAYLNRDGTWQTIGTLN